MKYEYDFENVPLTEAQQHMVSIGAGNIDELNVIIRDLINERAKDGWEPLYPFSVPQVWFRKQITARRKKPTK